MEWKVLACPSFFVTLREFSRTLGVGSNSRTGLDKKSLNLHSQPPANVSGHKLESDVSMSMSSERRDRLFESACFFKKDKATACHRRPSPIIKLQPQIAIAGVA